MQREPFGRLDSLPALRTNILPFCRLKAGEIWRDPLKGHRVGALDAGKAEDVRALMKSADKDSQEYSQLGIHDPPYNITVGGKKTRALFQTDTAGYTTFSRAWVSAALSALDTNAALYIWLGADQNAGFQPLPEFMFLMREFPELQSRSLITLRNQRGYGTQKNWMAVRQELLYYARGNPPFQVVYTDIPKTLKGYYKEAGGRKTTNQERGNADTIRPGNVWVDIQQVFYRRQENVPGAYAQKPLSAIERVIRASSKPGDLVTDFFAHSGTTLIAAERLGRVCRTMDIDPVFAELTIRRLEHLRATGKTGWQTENPFPELKNYKV
ncbi:MAG: site-specific DNA-methyltransferase [Spirochaetales bacterium]|jgi:site-specific DNA-methyltransferase (adenine-specific)|nr:site-specific DNA-methyltransferase [Spirochaetales bacterium]